MAKKLLHFGDYLITWRIMCRLKIVKERVNFLQAANKFQSAVIIYMAKREAFLIELPSMIQ